LHQPLVSTFVVGFCHFLAEYFEPAVFRPLFMRVGNTFENGPTFEF